jgi:hypothetical protein
MVILVVIPAVALAAVTIAAFLGQWVWWLDVLANFRAQYVVALAVLGLVISASAVAVGRHSVRSIRRSGVAVSHEHTDQACSNQDQQIAQGESSPASQR